jgi:hypothetical protein
MQITAVKKVLISYMDAEMDILTSFFYGFPQGLHSTTTSFPVSVLHSQHTSYLIQHLTAE